MTYYIDVIVEVSTETTTKLLLWSLQRAGMRSDKFKTLSSTSINSICDSNRMLASLKHTLAGTVWCEVSVSIRHCMASSLHTTPISAL